MLPSMSPILTFAFAGLTFCGILLLFSVFLKISGGRFWSLPFSLFVDKEREEAIGSQMRLFILKYIPLPFFCFLLLFFYLLWQR